MNNKSLKPVVYWLFTGYLLIFIMVVVGGITRLTGSGLSMADWKPIMGAIPPLNETDWLEKFELYKATPEYNIVNKHFSLNEFKSIFWWEFIHRNLGRFIGLVFFIPFVLFLFQKRINKKLITNSIIILFLGAFQGILGWYMVRSGLVDKPHVSHFRLAAHFSTALFTMLYIFWVAISIIHPTKTKLPTLNNKLKLLTFLISVQLIFGAFVAGLKAGFGNFTISDVFLLPNTINNIINDGTTVLFIHRYLALLILAYTLYTYITEIKNKNILNHQTKGLNIIIICVLLQVVLGVVTLINNVPINLGVIHQTFAIVVITSCVYLIKRT